MLKALILAAGTGTRLGLLTGDKPKTMLEIQGIPIIHHLIQALRRYGIDDITIVTGYQHQILVQYVLEAFPEKKIGFLYNPYYAEMNNIYSFHLTAPYFWGQDLLVCNADVFCEEEILRDIIYGPRDSVLVDPEKDYSAEATKVRIDAQGRIIEISKKISSELSQGEYIGIMKLSSQSCQLLYQKVMEMLQCGETGLWFVCALDRLLGQIKINPVFVNNRVWEEIDNAEDYLNAKHLAEKAASEKNAIY